MNKKKWWKNNLFKNILTFKKFDTQHKITLNTIY